MARIIRAPWFSLVVLLVGAAILTTWAVNQLSQLSAGQAAITTPIVANTVTPDEFDPLAGQRAGPHAHTRIDW